MATIEEMLQKIKGDLESKPPEEMTVNDQIMVLLGAILLELRQP